MSSGSSRAESAVEPTRSQNMTVRWRRSAPGRRAAVNSAWFSPAMARSILRRWPSRTPSLSKSSSLSSVRTLKSIPFSAKRFAYCASPSSSSQSAICCIWSTEGVVDGRPKVSSWRRDVIPISAGWPRPDCGYTILRGAAACKIHYQAAHDTTRTTGPRCALNLQQAALREQREKVKSIHHLRHRLATRRRVRITAEVARAQRTFAERALDRADDGLCRLVLAEML